MTLVAATVAVMTAAPEMPLSVLKELLPAVGVVEALPAQAMTGPPRE